MLRTQFWQILQFSLVIKGLSSHFLVVNSLKAPTFAMGQLTERLICRLLRTRSATVPTDITWSSVVPRNEVHGLL